MNDLLQSLKTEFHDEDYRYAYAQSFLNTKLASQIKTLREQRGMTQERVAAEMKIKQPGYRRFEDVNHAVWKTDSLWNIARAMGVRLDINFKTFGTLPDEKKQLNKESLQLPKFEDDLAFKEISHEERKSVAVAGTRAGEDLWLGNSMEAANKAIATYAAERQLEYGEALAQESAYPLGRPTRKRRLRRHSAKASPRPLNVIPFSGRPKRRRMGFANTLGASAMSYRCGVENLEAQNGIGTQKAS
jgi:transcriptional regulator with XRE-family HTH domain